MVLSEDSDDILFKKHQELCSKLNLDVGTVSQAWESFQNIQTNFTLEGDPLHWLGCAVYVACKKAVTPTVSRTLVEGNGVNLTSLLRHCNLSLTQFFNKITKWADMANMSDEFRHRIKRIEGNFAVSYNIFKKFTPIFSEIFKGPIDTELSRQHRNRKQRAPPCTPTKVFEFCWILFTTVKGENPPYSEDIVMSYHLLQACCDLAFKNAFLDDRRDLLNPNFSELPSNWSDPSYVTPKEAPCIINYLCSKHNGIATEAKYCKEYSWKNHLLELFSRGVLQGNESSFTGLLDPANFDANLKNLTKAYEAHLLNRGDFDERIFLAEYRRRLMLKEQALNSTNGALPFSPFGSPGDAMVTDSPRGEASLPGTPGAIKKSSLRPQSDFTPLSTATKCVVRLQNLLTGRQPCPSDNLIQIFQTCRDDPTERIKQVVEAIGDKFRAEFTRQNCNFPTVPPDYANQRLRLAVTLFYKFVEDIFQNEQTLHKDISHLAVKDIFYECTLACSLEIVIYSYNCQRKFPWILNALNIKPFYFVRVIELIVRSQDQLPRDAVKYLSVVEQKIIESLIWKSDSPIWQVLAHSGEEFPKFEDTALPGNMVYTEEQAASVNTMRKFPNEQAQSPGPSAVDRFQSPVNPSQSAEIRKQLFKPVQVNKALGSQIKKPSGFDKEGLYKVVQVLFDKESNKIIQLPDKQLEVILPKTEPVVVKTEVLPPAGSGKPKKTGSLSIIVRKFYNLAYFRMEHLCTLLDISELKFRQKIWTVFEHSIREHTDLMRDRHLDQLLMCAVYVVCKVTSTRERKFAEIMEHYRVQPQASSHIYRNVLISRGTDVSGKPTSEGEKRGDLISFYNSVYVQAMRSFALQFSSCSNQNSTITLSPLPLLVNNNLASPRCQITNNLFIMPYDVPNNNGVKSKNLLEYHFSRSPSKDLEKINNAINKSVVSKRLLGDEDEMNTPNKRFVSKKMQSLVEARLSHITE